MDKSNGYEHIASIFIKGRGQAVSGIGVSSVRNWARTLPPGADVLDLGCGTGVPVSKALLDEGMKVYGVDASPALVNAFRHNFPGIPVACEAAEESLFFNRKFDGIIAWGLLFLLSKKTQESVLQKAASALQPGGKLLFKAPYMNTEWKDVMTGQKSLSPGAEKYREILSSSGLSLVEEFEDEGENYYYNAVKM